MFWWLSSPVPNERMLARFSTLGGPDLGGTSWASFDVPADTPGGLVGVGSDGAVWVAGVVDAGNCDGISRFDGTSWTAFLAGTCPSSVDFSPDGNVWLQAVARGIDLAEVHTYVITPEAVAAAE